MLKKKPSPTASKKQLPLVCPRPRLWPLLSFTSWQLGKGLRALSALQKWFCLLLGDPLRVSPMLFTVQEQGRWSPPPHLLPLPRGRWRRYNPRHDAEGASPRFTRFLPFRPTSGAPVDCSPPLYSILLQRLAGDHAQVKRAPALLAPFFSSKLRDSRWPFSAVRWSAVLPRGRKSSARPTATLTSKLRRSFVRQDL